MIFLTGATGFVGRRVLAELLAQGLEVRALVRPQHGRAALTGPALTQVLGALEQPESYAGALEGADAIIHAAAKTVEGDGSGFERSNVDGTRALAAAAAEHGVARVIYLSSVGVYGHRDLRGVGEEEVRRPDTALSRSRVAAEDILLGDHSEDFSTTVLRPRFVYGPGDAHFLPGLVRAVRRYPILPCSGRARVSLVHVDDLAALSVAEALAEPCDAPSALHITDGEPRELRELFGIVAAHLQRRGPRLLPAPKLLLLALLRGYERARGRDPERAGGGLTSLRLKFLTEHSHVSDAALRARYPRYRFRTLSDHLCLD